MGGILMKNQRLSALMLAVTPTFKWVISLLAAATGIEYFLFHRAMDLANVRMMSEASAAGGYIPAFEQLLETAKPEYIFGSLFLLCSALFLYTGCEQKGGKLRYTLQRLSIPEREIHLSWAVYYSLCYLLLMTWQAAVLFWFYRIYAASPFGEGLSPSGFFLAAYRSDLLHSLLPLHDIPRHIRNIVLLPCLGICCSVFSFHLSRSRRCWSAITLIGLTAFSFIRPVANSAMDIFTLVSTAWLTAIAVRHTWRDPDAEQ